MAANNVVINDNPLVLLFRPVKLFYKLVTAHGIRNQKSDDF